MSDADIILKLQEGEGTIPELLGVIRNSGVLKAGGGPQEATIEASESENDPTFEEICIEFSGGRIMIYRKGNKGLIYAKVGMGVHAGKTCKWLTQHLTDCQNEG